ncbi:MAG: histidinol-phosphatase HisJ family protein [Patescibacteria group bacterium]
MLADYHMHTTFSDGYNSHLEMVVGAKEKGMTEIGFSDHFSFDEPEWSGKASEISQILEKVKQTRQTSKLSIKWGMEVDYLPDYHSQVVKILEPYLSELDYILGAIHYIGNWQCDDEKNYLDNGHYYYERDKIALLDPDKLFQTYHQLLQDAARTGLFDIMAHPDLIKKYAPKPKGDLTDVFNQTAKVFKETGVVVEINSSGLEAPCQEIYPSKGFLIALFKAGVPITFGSDAHSPDRIGRYFDQALALAKAVGYSEYIQFTKRQRQVVKL